MIFIPLLLWDCGVGVWSSVDDSVVFLRVVTDHSARLLFCVCVCLYNVRLSTVVCL